MSKFILLDTETSGLPTIKDEFGNKIETNHRVIQLGYLILDGKNVEKVEELASLPEGVEIDFFAMSTHHITPEDIEDKPLLIETEGFMKLNTDLNNPSNIIVIHNAPFDIGMLEREGFRNNMELIDTLRVAKHLYPDSDSHSLQYLRYSLGLYKTEQDESKKLNIELTAHDAMGDILFMKMLLSKMMGDIKEKFNIEKNKEAVAKMIELTSVPPLIKKFKFGKHVGKSVEEIVKSDSGYINWMLNSGIDDEDLLYTVNYWLKKNKEKQKQRNMNPNI